jgi:RHS repeat-associated protein
MGYFQSISKSLSRRMTVKSDNSNGGFNLRSALAVAKKIGTVFFALLFFSLAGAPVSADFSEGNADRDGMVVPAFVLPQELSAGIQNSGESTVAVPIIVPPGIRGLAPKLSLHYTSGAGDAGLGTGWKLDIGYGDAVRRSTRRGVPCYDQCAEGTADTFTYMGQDLVPDPQNPARFRTTMDSFEWIERQESLNRWIVKQRNGILLEYAAAGLIAPNRAYAWHLSRASDVNGNGMEFVYQDADNYRLLSEIRYTLRNGNPIGREQKVIFAWADRPDPRRSAVYGAEIQLTTRLDRIETLSDGTKVRTYDLVYADENHGLGSAYNANAKGNSLLVAVEEESADGTALPPRLFQYQQRQPGWTQKDEFRTPLAFAVYANPQMSSGGNPWRMFDAGVRLADVNGDGLVDMIRSNSYTQQLKGHGEVYLNDGAGGWSLDSAWAVPCQLVTENSLGNGSLDLGVRLLDVNGDGLVDLIQSMGGIHEVRLNNGRGWNAANAPDGYRLPEPGEDPSTFSFVNTIGLGSEDLGVRLADLNGDGLPDLIRARESSKSRVYFNNGKNGWDPAPEGSWQLPPQVLFIKDRDGHNVDAGARLIDINGDGLADIVRAFNDGEVVREVYLNNGAGWNEPGAWSFPFPLYNLQVIPGMGFFDLDYGLQVIDVDGDGYPDVLWNLPNQSGSEVWLNNQSSGFVQAQGWEVPVPLVAVVYNGGPTWYYVDNGVRIADVDGDGLADLVQGKLVRDYNNGQVTAIAETFSASAVKADLLAVYTNPLGGSAAIEYGRTSGLGTKPGQMPFTRTVVARLSEDARSGDAAVVTGYQFQDGLYDWQLRDFRGYQFVTETYADKTRREREFYLDIGRKGRLRAEILRDSDELIYRKRELLYSATPSNGVFISLVTREDELQFDQDNESDPVFKRTHFTYDGYGNLLTVRERDWGRMETFCEPGNAAGGSKGKIVVNQEPPPEECWDELVAGPVLRSKRITYSAPNEDLWMVNLPAAVERFEGDLLVAGNAPLAAEEFYYDDQQTLGAAPIRGLLTQKVLRDYRLEGLELASGATAVATAYEYDEYGNVIVETNGRGQKTYFNGYAENGFLFPLEIVRGNLKRSTRYDTALGVMLEATDPNGHATSYSYDGLGRLETIHYPDDPEDDPGITVTAYQLDTLPAFMEVVERLDENRSRIRREYYDGLGRAKGKVAGSGATWILSDVTRYDSRGRPYRVHEPAFRANRDFTNDPGSAYTQNEYEDDKVSETSYPGGSHTSNYYFAAGMQLTDENGVKTFYRRDAFGQLVEIDTDVGGSGSTHATTRYDYDGMGHLLAAEDPRGLVTEYFYDARGFLRGISYPDGGQQSLRNGYQVWNDYDEQGNPTHRWSGTDVLKTEYDALDRRTRRYVSTDSGNSWTFESLYYYDGGGVAQNALGRLTLVYTTPPTNYSLLEYDPRGRVTAETFYARGLDASLPSSIKVEYAHDREGKVTAIKDPRGRWVQYQRNSFGQIDGTLSSAIRYNNMWPERVVDIDYDASGRVKKIWYGHNVKDEFDYDPRGRMQHINKDVRGPLMIDYSYDDAGNLETETHRGRAYAMNFEYDHLHRLTGASGNMAGKSVNLAYDYDASGNLLSVIGEGGQDVTYTYSPDSNRLENIRLDNLPALGIGYDAEGNLTEIKDDLQLGFSRTYDYDVLGRLKHYNTDNHSGTLSYDGRDRKVCRTLDGGGHEVYFHTIDGQVLATYSRGKWKTYLLAEGLRLAYVDENDRFRYMHSDRLGSVRMITADAQPSAGCFDEETGKPIPCPPVWEVIWRADYLPFGLQENASSANTGDNFRFTGQEFEPGLGAYDYGARYYDPLLRRFLQIDSYIGDPLRPRTLNRYSYALNNPAAYVDPTGNMACNPEQPESQCYSDPAPPEPDASTDSTAAAGNAEDNAETVQEPIQLPEVVVYAPKQLPENTVWNGEDIQPAKVQTVFGTEATAYNNGKSLYIKWNKTTGEWEWKGAWNTFYFGFNKGLSPNDFANYRTPPASLGSSGLTWQQATTEQKAAFLMQMGFFYLNASSGYKAPGTGFSTGQKVNGMPVTQKKGTFQGWGPGWN